MKKTIFIIAVAVSLVFASCKEKTEKVEAQPVEITTASEKPEAKEESATVVGVWKMTNIELVGMQVPKGQEAAMEEMKKKMIDATVYTFNDDATMSFKNNLVKETTGTYKNEDGKITIHSNTTKQDETFAINELTANKLVITSEQGGRKAVMSFEK